MSKIKFTQLRIEALAAPDTGRVDYHDTGCSGLTCRVSHTGIKSFVVLKWNGKNTQRITLGKFPSLTVKDAQVKANEIKSDLIRGINPTEEKRKDKIRGITLQELMDQYLANKTDLREATVFDYNQKLRQGFADWLSKPVNEITEAMVLARRRHIEKGVDNKLRVLRLLMHYAVRRKIIEVNPVNAVTEERLWSAPIRKKRMISKDSLKDWNNAVMALENEKAKIYLLLLLHTGLRDTDVRYLEWTDIDFKNDCLQARDTKNGTDFTAYLAPQIKPHLRALQALTGTGKYLFPGDTKDGVMGIPRKPIQQVCKEANLEFSSHDLKRTFLTIGEAALIPFSLLKALANHKTGRDVTEGYIIAEAHTLREATHKIADAIQAGVSDAGGNVVSINISASY